MGDAAEDMLDGTCCEGCGEFFDDILNGAEPPGYPRYCSRECEPASGGGLGVLPVSTRLLRDTMAQLTSKLSTHGHNPPYASKADKR